MPRHALALALALATPATGCEESFDGDGAGGGSPGAPSFGETGAADAGTASGFGEGLEGEGVVVDVTVPASGRAYVDLRDATVTDEAGPWDLAFEGLEVYTHGGITAPGPGAAFGPYAALQFLGDVRPEVPFLIADHAGGAFVDWYAYDGASHALYSRYHVVGVRRGAARYKVQILGYYGEIDGAPVSAVYSLRVASVDDDVGETVSIEDLDGTAGGPSPGDDDPSGCIALDRREVFPLTVAESRSSDAWDLCFRRDVITVNGELGGPGEVEAVDLDAATTASETLADVQARSAASESARFDAVDAETLDDPALAWRGDRVISAFSDAWIRVVDGVLGPAAASWLVVGDDGAEYLVVFESFTGATTAHPGTVRVRLKPL